MSVIAPNPSIMHRGLYCREQQSFLSTSNSCSNNVLPSVGGLFAVSRNGNRRDKLRAFWDTRPVSIEMEPISGIGELEEILKHSKDSSQPILIDWLVFFYLVFLSYS